METREDKATIKCETSPPSSPRSLRLETNFAQLTGSLEDGRGGKAKKGIKSSLGRLFGKSKEKGRMEGGGTLGREGQPLPVLMPGDMSC